VQPFALGALLAHSTLVAPSTACVHSSPRALAGRAQPWTHPASSQHALLHPHPPLLPPIPMLQAHHAHLQLWACPLLASPRHRICVHGCLHPPAGCQHGLHDGPHKWEIQGHRAAGVHDSRGRCAVQGPAPGVRADGGGSRCHWCNQLRTLMAWGEGLARAEGWNRVRNRQAASTRGRQAGLAHVPVCLSIILHLHA